MEIPDRRIVMMRPGSLVHGVVKDGNFEVLNRGAGLIASVSLVVYVARGEGWFRSANVEGPLRPGTLVCAPAGPIDCEICEDHEAVVLIVRVPAAGRDGFIVPFVRQLSPVDGAAWHDRLRGIVELAEDDRVRAEHVQALRCDLSQLVWLKRAPYAQETLRGVFGEMWERQGDALLLDQLAAATGYTRNYLNDLVRGHTGRPIGKWIADIRMARARHDLECSGLQIADIATSCGYGDGAYFSRAFRRLHGVPPAIWRIAKQAGDLGDHRIVVLADELEKENGYLSSVDMVRLRLGGQTSERERR